MAEKKTPKDQGFEVLMTSIKAVNKSVDKLSVKLDGITNIAMSMSNEIARLDERVTFALDQQKNQTADMADVQRRLAKLESYDAADNKMKDISAKILLVVLSVLGTGIIMYVIKAP